MKYNIGNKIHELRKNFGLSQENLAKKIGVSFQAVSKWENGISCPDIEILPKIADIFHVSIDYLILGTSKGKKHYYEDKYNQEDFYWGLQPAKICFEILKLLPPTKKYKVLNVGCGEGKDSIFLARNGYDVSCFDVTHSGVKKARIMAERLGLHINAFVADVCEFRISSKFDIILVGNINNIPVELRAEIFKNYKDYTNTNGLNVFSAFLEKPFNISNHQHIPNFYKCYSGEILRLYHDWKVEMYEETICDCKSKHLPNPHAISSVIVKKII